MRIPHLLEQASAEIERFAAAPTLLLALDFDGTLSPIAPTPGEARIAPRAARALEELRAERDPGLCIAIVSGRRVADLALLAPPVDVRVGLHGLEIELEGQAPQIPFDTRTADDALKRLRERLGRALALGARLEDKGHAIALHVRGLAAELASAAIAEFTTAFEIEHAAGAPLDFLRGKAVVEARPIEASKRWAIRRLLEDRSEARLAFAGDDTTDEDVFAAFPEALTIAVLDRDRPTAARTYVRSPDEVATFLEMVLERRLPQRT